MYACVVRMYVWCVSEEEVYACVQGAMSCVCDDCVRVVTG
jgi:hypothetical protein